MVLPARSAGVRISESANTCTAEGVVCRKTPTLLIFTPLSILLRTAEVSAQPKSVWLAPVAWAVLVEP